MNDEITVVIPIRDRAQALWKFLDQFLEQDYPRELVTFYFFTHDNSDETYQILTEWASKHGDFDRIVIDKEDMDFPPDRREEEYREKYIRPAMIHAFNRCLDFGSTASGDCVIFMDSDSFVGRDFFTRMKSGCQKGVLLSPLTALTVQIGEKILNRSNVYRIVRKDGEITGVSKIKMEDLKDHEEPFEVDFASGITCYFKDDLSLGFRFSEEKTSKRFEFDYFYLYKNIDFKVIVDPKVKVNHDHGITFENSLRFYEKMNY